MGPAFFSGLKLWVFQIKSFFLISLSFVVGVYVLDVFHKITFYLQAYQFCILIISAIYMYIFI